MRERIVRVSSVAGLSSLFLVLSCLTLVAQGSASSPSAAPASGPALRTPNGRPDLQGVWSFATLTPLERPAEFGNRRTLTPEEAAQFAEQALERSNKDRRDGGSAADVSRAYNDFWWDYGKNASTQTSLVVDPPDGRIPPLTAAAQRRLSEARQGSRTDNPEERSLSERCVLGFNSGPPMVPSAYNNNVQIVQTGDAVLIHNEMIHSARIVHFDRRDHLPASIRSLTGDSIGRWDGDTLVVDTTNFLTPGVFRGSSANLHLVERFSLAGSDTLRYEFTIDDPSVWTKPWTASIPMSRSDEPIYEYACHEGNIGLEGILKGARYLEHAGSK
jgi:hypothetical protein